jgi:uncharacterized protein YkwD
MPRDTFNIHLLLTLTATLVLTLSYSNSVTNLLWLAQSELAAHNTYRSAHKAQPLQLNFTLSAQAQQHAEFLASSKTLQRLFHT